MIESCEKPNNTVPSCRFVECGQCIPEVRQKRGKGMQVAVDRSRNREGMNAVTNKRMPGRETMDGLVGGIFLRSVAPGRTEK